MEADPNMNIGVFSHYDNHLVPSFSLQYNGPSGFDGIESIVPVSRNADAANGISFVMPPGSSPADMVLSPARRLVHGPAWTIEWSPQEQAILNCGLEEFANDPVITKYVKIAASLRTKTVRDVAMRCQWMKMNKHDKRQKAEAMHIGKRMDYRKERLASSSLGAHNHQLMQTASSSSQPVMHNSNANQNNPIPGEVWCLIEENNRALDQIVRNLEKGQMQNGALFNRVGSNIKTILLGINGVTCSLRKMPPLPVSINDDLFNAIWPNFFSMAHTSSSFNLSDVPRRYSS